MKKLDGTPLKKKNFKIYTGLIFSVGVLFLSIIFGIQQSLFSNGQELENDTNIHLETSNTGSLFEQIKETVKTEETEKVEVKKSQSYYGINITGKEFMDGEFLNFIDKNSIKNLRITFEDYISNKQVIDMYVESKELELLIVISQTKQLEDISKFGSKVKTLEANVSNISIKEIQSIKEKLDLFKQTNGKEIGILLVGLNESLVDIYKQDKQSIFDYWGQYEFESLENSKQRINEIQQTLLINNEEKEKGIIVTDFTVNDKLTFIQEARKNKYIKTIYFHSYKDFQEVIDQILKQKAGLTQ